MCGNFVMNRGEVVGERNVCHKDVCIPDDWRKSILQLGVDEWLIRTVIPLYT